MPVSRPTLAKASLGAMRDTGNWLPWPDTFDDAGFPLQLDGASPVVPGLYFVGLHFMRKR